MHTDMNRDQSHAGAPGGEVSAEQDVTATAPGQLRVIKRNGKVVSYDDDKITVAITKAFLAVEGGTAAASSRIHDTVDRLTEQVSATFKRRMPSGGTIHIEEIQDQVELALMRNGEHKVARDYVLYRDQQARKRAERGMKAMKRYLRQLTSHRLPVAESSTKTPKSAEERARAEEKNTTGGPQKPGKLPLCSGGICSTDTAVTITPPRSEWWRSRTYLRLPETEGRAIANDNQL